MTTDTVSASSMAEVTLLGKIKCKASSELFRGDFRRLVFGTTSDFFDLDVRRETMVSSATLRGASVSESATEFGGSTIGFLDLD